LELGGHLRVVVPCHGYEQTFADQKNLKAFSYLLSKADTTEMLPYPEPSEEAFFAAGRRVVELSEILVAVWDGREAKGKGGTADIVQYARDCGNTVFVIWPPGIHR
jgi:hypothetical protein